MNAFGAAFWAEALKARRSKISLGISLGFMILPLFGGLFMIILKDPERARAMGIIGVKAQIVGGVADWPSFFDMLLQGGAIGGAILFAFITSWVFGREFSDHTVKELLALPTSRQTIVGAKFLLIFLWILGLSLMIFLVGLMIGTAVDIPGWSSGLMKASFWSLLLTSLINLMLMPLVAFIASAGRGYLPPLAWAILTMALAMIAGVLGWGDRFPWAVPMLVSGMSGPRSEQVSVISYGMVSFAFLVGITATFGWWLKADQAR